MDIAIGGNIVHFEVLAVALVIEGPELFAAADLESLQFGPATIPLIQAEGEISFLQDTDKRVAVIKKPAYQ